MQWMFYNLQLANDYCLFFSALKISSLDKVSFGKFSKNIFYKKILCKINKFDTRNITETFNPEFLRLGKRQICNCILHVFKITTATKKTVKSLCLYNLKVTN